MMKRKTIVAATVLMLTLLLSSLSTVSAQQPRYITVVNNHANAYLRVSAFDVNDVWRAIACQTLPLSRDNVRYIASHKVSGADPLFHDHCGNYDTLSLTFYIQIFSSATQYKDYHLKTQTVPWGATVTLHNDLSLSCVGCAWSRVPFDGN